MSIGSAVMSPMIFETSRQARFMIPMAISLGFGILFSTAIVLVLVPALYIILEDVKAGVARVFGLTTVEEGLVEGEGDAG